MLWEKLGMEKPAARSGSARSAVKGCLSERDFIRFAELVHERCGIKLPPSKKTMVEARLQKRLRALGLPDYKGYCGFVFSEDGLEEELPHLLDVITTNTTDFFREPRHFDVLIERILPRWHSEQRGRRELSVWSAGCSTGEEPYTLGMVLSEFERVNPEFRWMILATDISTRVLEHARRAVYSEEKISPIPMEIKRRYLLRSKDRAKRLVRIAPELRRKVQFRRLNFMDNFDFREAKDIIFCRNVMIYFERATQEELLRKFCAYLNRGGFLFIGHSESLTGMSLPLKQLAPTIYQRV